MNYRRSKVRGGQRSDEVKGHLADLHVLTTTDSFLMSIANVLNSDITGRWRISWK